MKTRLIIPGVLAAMLLLTGCSTDPGKNEAPVDVSGTVTLNGKPVDGVILTFQATGRGAQANIPVKNGQYKGAVTPGKYTYFVTEGTKPAVFKTIPEKFLAGSLDRQVDVSAETTLDVKLD